MATAGDLQTVLSHFQGRSRPWLLNGPGLTASCHTRQVQRNTAHCWVTGQEPDGAGREWLLQMCCQKLSQDPDAGLSVGTTGSLL